MLRLEDSMSSITTTIMMPLTVVPIWPDRPAPSIHKITGVTVELDLESAIVGRMITPVRGEKQHVPGIRIWDYRAPGYKGANTLADVTIRPSSVAQASDEPPQFELILQQSSTEHPAARLVLVGHEPEQGAIEAPGLWHTRLNLHPDEFKRRANLVLGLATAEHPLSFRQGHLPYLYDLQHTGLNEEAFQMPSPQVQPIARLYQPQHRKYRQPHPPYQEGTQSFVALEPGDGPNEWLVPKGDGLWDERKFHLQSCEAGGCIGNTGHAVVCCYLLPPSGAFALKTKGVPGGPCGPIPCGTHGWMRDDYSIVAVQASWKDGEPMLFDLKEHRQPLFFDIKEYRLDFRKLSKGIVRVKHKTIYRGPVVPEITDIATGEMDFDCWVHQNLDVSYWGLEDPMENAAAKAKCKGDTGAGCTHMHHPGYDDPGASSDW